MKKFVVAAVLSAAVCVSVSAKKEAAETVFGIKSGIITISTDMEMPDFSQFAGMGGGAGAPAGAPAGGAMGGFDFANFDMSDMVEIIYFDDYGRKTARVTKSGERITRTVAIGDTTYTINETANTATAMPIFGGARGGRGGMGMMGGFGGMGGASIGTIGQIDWRNLDKKTIRRNKIQELGEETVAGVTCKKYSMSVVNQMMGSTTNTTLCVYEGVVLSTETLSDWSTTPTTSTAVQFEINPNIPESTFQLPEGCEVSQPNFGGMGGFGGGFGGDFGGGMGGGFGGGMGGGFGGGMMF
ncbi:MAG: hypothetical protein MJY75_05910 [Bacteroidaceae bacterium]|nr:hypothetical protein [Bacteroidaceae bacterium]